MAYIGKVPTAVPLGTSDLADGIVTVSKLASTLDLSGNTITLPSGVGGKVLQVVQTVKTDTFTTTSTSFVDVTGLSATITPSSTSSKILILYEIMVSAYGSQFYIKLLRGSTDIYIGDSAGSRKRVTNNHWLGDPNNMFSSVISYLDSPNSTSATTYKIQAHTQNSSYAFCVNRTQSDGDTSNMPRGSSSITLMEIAG